MEPVTSTDSKTWNAFSGSFQPCVKPFLLSWPRYEDYLKVLALEPFTTELHPATLFFISVYAGLQVAVSLYITGTPVLPRNFRNSSLFTATCKTLRPPDLFLLLTNSAQTRPYL